MLTDRIDFTTDSWYAQKNPKPQLELGYVDKDLNPVKNQEFKADAGKANPVLLEKGCVHALKAVQATLDYGAQKYEPNSWQRVDSDRYDNAARRHRIDRDAGELRDRESNLLHLAHEIIDNLFVLEKFIKDELEKDPTFDYTKFNPPPTAHKNSPAS